MTPRRPVPGSSTTRPGPTTPRKRVKRVPVRNVAPGVRVDPNICEQFSTPALEVPPDCCEVNEISMSALRSPVVCWTKRRPNRDSPPMPDLYLHNSLTRRKERFEPADPSNIRMYVCGPTVYDLAHLGNARPVVVYDVIARLLRFLYPKVTYVRNITDVEDKINARARETGESIASLTARTTADFHADMAALGALPPDQEPRATAHIAEMIMIIERLIESGHAYAAEGHVLFAV